MSMWICAIRTDEKGTHSYYYNNATGESTYEVPEGFYDSPASKWVVCVDTDSGALYYVDQATGESVWDEPAPLAALGKAAAGEESGAPTAKARPRPPPTPPAGPPPSIAVRRQRRVSVVSDAPPEVLGASSSSEPAAASLPPRDAAASSLAGAPTGGGASIAANPAETRVASKRQSGRRRQTFFKKRSSRRMSTTAAPAPVRIEGMLLKKSTNGVWQPRYFSTNSHYLLYSAKKGGKTLGGVDLGGAGSSVQRCEFKEKELVGLSASTLTCVSLHFCLSARPFVCAASCPPTFAVHELCRGPGEAVRRGRVPVTGTVYVPPPFSRPTRTCTLRRVRSHNELRSSY